jgi:hypothetical protein
MRKFLIIAFALAATSAFAQVWVETGDAPSGVPAHQNTVGVGALSTIRGNLFRANGDHVDTYCINIVSRSLFYATTLNFYGGSATSASGANQDTRLWLWNMNGGVQLGNDDVNGLANTDQFASLVSDPTTFGGLTGGELVNATASGIVLNPGTYLLSISIFSNDPDDAGGIDLVNLGADFDALHGPNPAAGAFDHWENPASTTDVAYSIALRGTEYCAVPEPASMIALGLGAAALLRRRRKQ